MQQVERKLASEAARLYPVTGRLLKTAYVDASSMINLMAPAAPAFTASILSEDALHTSHLGGES